MLGAVIMNSEMSWFTYPWARTSWRKVTKWADVWGAQELKNRAMYPSKKHLCSLLPWGRNTQKKVHTKANCTEVRSPHQVIQWSLGRLPCWDTRKYRPSCWETSSICCTLQPKETGSSNICSIKTRVTAGLRSNHMVTAFKYKVKGILLMLM